MVIQIVITATAYVTIKDCAAPAVISKDLSLVVYDRSSRATATSYRSTFRNLLFAKPDDQSRVIGIYELTLRTAREMRDTFGRVYHPHVIDDQHATSVYVRGEENLQGWRPRGDSLLFEHRWVQEKIRRILMVEQAKHVLRLRSLLTGGTDLPGTLIDATGVPTKSESEGVYRSFKIMYTQCRVYTVDDKLRVNYVTDTNRHRTLVTMHV